MNKFISTIIKSVPTLITLFRSRTSQSGKGIVKSGVASLTISGMISSGKMTAGEMDATLLIILSILEAIGYLYGLVAVSSGASQTCPEEELLQGRGDGLNPIEAEAMGNLWLRRKIMNEAGHGEFKDMPIPEAKDISAY